MTTKGEFLEEENVIEEEVAEGEEVLEPVGSEEVEEEFHDVSDPVKNEAVRLTSDVPVQVVAVLGKKTISVKELVSLHSGQVLDLARPVNEVVDLIANGKMIAKGELVEIDGKMGVKIVKLIR